MQNSFVKKTKKEKIPVKKCYQCLIPCDVKNTPYCISRALIEAVKGNLEDGLIFTGAHGYRQDHLMHVDEVIHELMEDDKEIRNYLCWSRKSSCGNGKIILSS